MFKVTQKGTDRVDVDVSGKLDSDDMRMALDELATNTLGVQNGRMLYRIDDFAIPSLGALGVELSRLPTLLRLIRKFDRIAVLVDREWMQKVSEIEGALMPGLEVKAFDRDEEAEAESWLAR